MSGNLAMGCGMWHGQWLRGTKTSFAHVYSIHMFFLFVYESYEDLPINEG